MAGKDKVWTVLSMLNWATAYFEKANVTSPRLSIEWLLAEILEEKRLNLYLQYDRPLSQNELDKLRPLVKRRFSHEPLQYIIGFTEFMDCKIEVNPDVLIPRIETEQLVEIVLDKLPETKGQNLHLLDIGTGSGCIPIAIKKKREGLICFGTDISELALQLAKLNAEKNDTDVDFFKGDIFDHSSLNIKNWDIIISNPPYITPEEKTELEKQVIEYEPGLALFHEDPLSVYRSIIKFASKNNSLLFLECNDKTADKVQEIANQFYSESELLNDLDNNPRFVVAKGSHLVE